MLMEVSMLFMELSTMADDVLDHVDNVIDHDNDTIDYIADIFSMDFVDHIHIEVGHYQQNSCVYLFFHI